MSSNVSLNATDCAPDARKTTSFVLRSYTWSSPSESTTASRLRSSDTSRHLTPVACTMSSIGNGLSTCTLSTWPLARPMSRPSWPAGPPSTLMYRMTSASTHSRSFVPAKLYICSLRSWHMTMCSAVTTSRWHGADV